MKTNLLKSIFISLILVLGTVNAWAVDHTGGYVYFLKPSTWTESKVMMFIGNDSYTSVYEMTKVSNTDNLYRYDMPSWGGATYVAFANASSVWGSGNWGPSNRTNATHYTNVYNNYGFNSGSYYVVVPASTSNNAGITINYKSSASNLNLTTRANVYGSTDGGSTYSSMAAAGTVSVSGYYMSNYSTASTRSEVSSTASQAYASTTLAPGSTATFKATAKTGYEFVGWFTAASGGTAVFTDATYTFKYDISYTGKTLYARFKQIQHTVSYGICSTTRWGSIKLNSETAITTTGTKTLNYGTSISFTATPNAGYQVEGWYSNSGCTSKITAAGTSTTYDAGTLTANKTVYVKFEAIPANTHTITYTAQGTGWTYGTKPTSAKEGATVTFVVTPVTGYDVTVTTDGPQLTRNGNEYSFEMPGKDVAITVIAEEILVTVSPTNAYDKGNPGYANPTASNSGQIGISSTSQLVAPSPGEGYTFAGWTLSDNIVVTTGNASSNRTITVRHKTGDGSAVSAVANYNENLDSHWHLVGDDGYVFPDEWGVSNNNKMQKRSGSAAEKVVYMTLHFSNLRTYQFKVVNDNGSNNENNYTWYGYSTGNTFLDWTETSTKTVYTTTQEYNNDNNLKFTPNAVGDYEFKVDYSGTYPKVTITYPELSGQSIYLVGEFNWDIDDSNKFTETSEGSGVYQLTKHFEARDRHQTTTQGQPEYEFKLRINNTNYTVEGNGNEKHLQYTRQSTSKVINDGTSYSGPYYNLLLQADITGDYVFTYYAATQTLTVQHPEYQPEASYLVGDFSDGVEGTDNLPKDDGAGLDWTEAYGIPITVDGNTGSVEVCNWPAGTWEFKVKINGLWYGLKDLNITQSGIYELTDAYAEMGDRNVSMITTSGECYSFTYNLNNDKLEVEIVYGNETHTVTFNTNGNTAATTPATQTVKYGKTATEPTMSDANNRMFAGWYTDANCTQKYDFSKAVKTDIILYAKWIPYTQCIFFKNNLKWNNVYVYTFNNEMWHNGDNNEDPKDDKGVQPKENRIEYGKMTQVGETDIYYYILTDLTGFRHIAFSEKDMHTYDYFYDSKAIYRGDRSDQMPLFIPQTDQTATTTNNTKYYSSGIWMKYNSTESGYDWRGATDENNQEQWSKKYDFTASKPGGYSFTATVEFDNTSTHYFKIHNTKGDWFGNGGTMTQDNCTDWTFGTDNTENAKITPTITGKYIFTVYLGDGEVSVSLDYPLSVGDYRLAYKDSTTNSHHPGHYLKKHSTTQTDTVSFFIHHNQQPEIFVEKCTKITDGKPTWAKVAEITNNPAASITESGVYNFFLQQVEGNTLPTLVNKAMPYTGNFYIRTDAADGGWDSFRQKSNEITYSSFADTHSNFNHYYCKYIDAGRNVKFTIANDYSYCISDTLDNDEIIREGQSSIGCLPINANVRFGWDSNTNEISRAYIKGAGMTSDRFLVLQGKDENLKDANGNVIPKGTGTRTGLEANEEILVDQQNWIYQVEVTANNQTLIKLIAEYNGAVQYFKGNAENYAGLLSSTAATSYKIRLVYDFKSNNLVAAMVLDGNKEVEEDDALGTDMMVIRRNQEHAEQLTFNPNSKQLAEVGTVYAVMTFTSEWINGTAEARERSLYWVSFPFDVKVSDVFGFGEYGEEWILQYYDGAERAEKGLFGDSGTYWKYIEDTKTTLNAGTGYVLALDLSKVKFLHGATEVSLYFPSIGEVDTITGELPTEAPVPEHWCNIDREWTENGKTYYHKYTDSHWNLIGVPGFADIDFDLAKTDYHFMQNDASFYYNFNLAESTYAVEASHVTEFQAMYAYMVQFAGTINWTSSEVSGVTPVEPKLAARRYSDSQAEKLTLRLELAQADKKVDQTFVQLQQEGATSEFDLSVDLTKIINSGANIYTLAGEYSIQTAGNALPMEEAVVPVGVQIATEGEYTFRMPDGTEGMVVELLDYEANTRTNLLLSDYTVTLQKGSNENRFALYIQPSKSGVSTSIENVNEGVNGGEAVIKYLIDGKLFIRTADGVLYDAQGHVVQ